MPEFRTKPRTVKAIQWTGEPLNDEIVAQINEVCGGLPHVVTSQGILQVSGPLGSVAVMPAIPEHEHLGVTYPAKEGQHVTICDMGHIHVWDHEAFLEAFE